jgi:non-specific serine/threonine protein kinase
VAPKPARRTLPEGWLRSLTAADPWLAESFDPAQVAELAAQVDDWVRSGLAGLGSARLCLRIHEPDSEAAPATATGERAATAATSPEGWRIEALAQDVDEPSLVVPVADVFTGTAPFGPDAVDDLLGSLGRAVRVAPELQELLAGELPDQAELTSDAVVALLQERLAPLADAGIALLLPSWWTNRRRLGVRARARASTPTDAVVAGGLSFDALVDFTWEAALGDVRLTRADLAKLRAAGQAKRSLVRVRGQWVEVRPDELAAVLAAAGTKGRATSGDLLRTGLGLDALTTPSGAPLVGVDVTGALGHVLDDALHASVTPLPTPDGFHGRLRPYQERGAGWLTFLGRLGLGACLADDMGLGKTAQLIATLVAEPLDQPALVVCPTSVLGNWERELARFAPHLRVLLHHGPERFRGHDEPFADRVATSDVVVTSYALLARDADILGGCHWSRLVLDEAQLVKNAHTAQAKAVHRIDAPRRVALTGTPVENRLGELWSIMHAVNPGLLGTAPSFRRTFAVPIERDGDEEAIGRLQRVVSPFVLRRLKSDRSIIDDLPDKVEQTQRCPLTEEQATLYQAVVDELLATVEETDGIERRGIVLSGILKLKQVCNHPAHFLKDGSRLAGRSGKLQRAEELLDQVLATGDKALCFTQFAEWGELLAPYLARRFRVEVPWLHGGVRRARRDEFVAAFQQPDGPPILLVSLKAGGTGLNLTAASHVFHFDRWWNPAVEDQATDRAYRIGQHRNVLVHKLVAAGTVEEHIDEMITKKRALAEAVVGTGERWVTELSTDALRSVLALQADAVEV